MKIGIYGSQPDIEGILGYFGACKDIEVAAIFDNDLARAQTVSANNNITQYAKSIKDIQSAVSLDVIYINAIPELRHQYIKMVMESGYDVLVDYPVSFKIEDIEEVYKVAEKLNKRIYLLPEFPTQKIKVSINKNTDFSCFGKLQGVNINVGLSEYVEQMRSYLKPNEIHWFYKLAGNIFQYYLPSVLHIINIDAEEVIDIEVIESTSNILPKRLTDEVVIKLSTKQAPVTIKLSLKDSLSTSAINYHYTKSVITRSLIDGTACSIKGAKLSVLKNTSIANLYSLIGSFLCKLRKSIHNSNPKENVIKEFYTQCHESGSRLIDIHDKDRLIEDIRLTNMICNKLVNTRLCLDNYIPLLNSDKNLKGRVLVTGGTGMFGIEIVEQLLNAGYFVRVLARKLSNISKLKDINAEIFYGDVGDLESVTTAMKDVNYVVHAAADSAGDERGGEISTILGTGNILKSARAAGVKNIVYISSCNVYEVATQLPGAILDEDSLLERNPQLRGEYTNAKIVAEKLVQDQMKVPGIQITCLRPGSYYGPGKYIFTPMLGVNIKEKVFFIIKNTKFILPLVYYKNVANAVLTTLDCNLSHNVIYNVIDEERLNKQQYVEKFLKKVFPRSLFIYVPYIVIWLLSIIFEILFKIFNIKPRLTRYRLSSSQNSVIYSSKKIKKDLNWKPPYTLYEGFENVTNDMSEKLSN